jgi:hypothetical protein
MFRGIKGHVLRCKTIPFATWKAANGDEEGMKADGKSKKNGAKG